MWVSMKYDTVILKITIHTAYTKHRFTKHPKHLLEEHVTSTTGKHPGNPNQRLSGKGISSPALLPAHAIQYRTIIAKVEDTQNTKRTRRVS